MGLLDYLEAIKEYFSWDRVNTMFPEGRGIYDLVEVDLSIAHTDKKINFQGDQVIVTESDSQAYLKLNDPANDLIDLAIVKQINSTFRNLYVTNSAGSGKLKLLVGRDGMFRSSSIIPVDILKSNIGNLPIDIKALTVGNVGIDIKASTLGNVPIDINASTLGNIPIDIQASTLGNVPIDINASTLGNLPVDIKASTIGNIDVDLNAQSIGNLDINLNAQSIDRLLFRDHEGGIESSNSLTKNCPKATETTIHNLASGKGGLTSFFIYVTAQTGGHYIAPRIYIDGTLMHPALHFGEWNTMGADTNSRPFQLMNYAVNGLCSGQYYFIKPIVFDSSLSLRVYNHSATDDVTANFYWFYQKIT